MLAMRHVTSSTRAIGRLTTSGGENIASPSTSAVARSVSVSLGWIFSTSTFCAFATPRAMRRTAAVRAMFAAKLKENC